MNPNAPSDFAVYAKSLIEALHNFKIASQLAHWNIKGPDFPGMHDLFGRIYGSLDDQMDPLVENLRALDYFPTQDDFRGPELFHSTSSAELLRDLHKHCLTVLAIAGVFDGYCSSPEQANPCFAGLANTIQGLLDQMVHLLFLIKGAM